MADHTYEMAQPGQKEILDALQETKNEVKRQKRLFYIVTGVLVLLALSVRDDSSSSVQQLKSDACSSGPCVNQGTCVGIPPDDYVCSCVATYYGRNCEKALKDTAFFVTYKAYNTAVPAGAVITWDDVRYDPGNNYDTVTGAYTAPSDGFYQFSVTKRTEGEYLQIMIVIDGKRTWYCWTRRSNLYTQAQTDCTVNVQLEAGQKVQVKQESDTNVLAQHSNGYTNSWFIGQMLYPLP